MFRNYIFMKHSFIEYFIEVHLAYLKPLVALEVLVTASYLVIKLMAFFVNSQFTFAIHSFIEDAFGFDFSDDYDINCAFNHCCSVIFFLLVYG